MTTIGNKIFSASNEQIRIWDLKEQNNIGEIQVGSIIKSLMIYQNMLLVATGKIVLIYDINTLK